MPVAGAKHSVCAPYDRTPPRQLCAIRAGWDYFRIWGQGTHRSTIPVDTTTPTPDTTLMTTDTPKRRWFQFRLRTLLAIMLLLSLFFAWLGAGLQRARRSQQTWTESHTVVDTITDLAGEVGCEWAVDYDKYPLNWLDRLLGYQGELQVRALTIHVAFDDVGMAHLDGLDHLEKLDLDGTQITDSGMKHLEGVIMLRKLSLRDTQISDVGLQHLSQLRNLKHLDLRGTRVTPEGIQNLIEGWPPCEVEY